MKELIKQTGGYKRHMDYLLTLQSEVMGVQNAMFKNLGHDLVLSGCEITDHQNGTVSIAPGVVYVSGQIVKFIGAANITSDGSKCLVLSNPVQTDPDDFFDGTTKNTYKEVFAQVGDTSDLTRQIIILPRELYGVKQYIQDIVLSYGQKGETKWVIDLDGTFLDNFDSSGLGSSARWMGWALMNGNNGTPPMAGRSAIGVGRVTIQGQEFIYNHNEADGNPIHQLTVAELPSHNHSYTDEFPADDYQTWGDNANSRRFAKNQTKTKTTQSAGNNQPHNNMPPYRAGYWVIKIA
ncbi:MULTISPECIES: hypothetical protein [unclassified Sphingobacterium]|uniref:hypothetical protein n=1 Tax=unclassified Sphingobacterium TaxID=2609468 RepID=UPI0025CFCF95|nr:MULTISPECIES: hypothetical protein [unclassified Sphingobacterium]